LEYRVLGKLEVVRDGVPLEIGAFRQRSLLALLLMNANNVVSTTGFSRSCGVEAAATDRQNTLWVIATLSPDAS